MKDRNIYKVVFFNSLILKETSEIFMEVSDKKAIERCEKKWPARLKSSNKIHLGYLYRKNETDMKKKEWIEIMDWVLREDVYDDTTNGPRFTHERK